MFTTDSLDKTMAKAKRVEILTKATKFSSVFRDLASGKLSEKDFVKVNNESITDKNFFDLSTDNINDFIKENPNEKIFDIVFKNDSENNLPFFKSIQEKLSKIYA